MGFGIPIASWLRGPLKPGAHGLIADSDGEMAQMLDLVALRRLLDRHASGIGDWHQPSWTALMFPTWVRSLGEPVGAPSSSAKVPASRKIVTTPSATHP